MSDKPTKVFATRRAERDLRRAPRRIQERFQVWVNAVETMGLREVRRNPGLHDEPRRGDREGQRSVRLNLQWRAIYRESESGELIIVTVEEVTPHAY